MSPNSQYYEEFIEDYKEQYLQNQIIKKQQRQAAKEQIVDFESYKLKPNKMQLAFINNLIAVSYTHLEVTDVICDECGRNMVVKYGPYGKFLACPGFPECRNTKPHFEKVGIPCPMCGGEVVLKKTKKGRKYYGCENNPECEFMSWQKPSTVKCEKCGSYMLSLIHI